jgi:CO/xanthine dehydrogenase Mo-binding subunit
MVFDENGKLKNPSFVDYKLINAVEMPRMSIHFVETPLEDGPYGARGFGEHVMVPTAPAIANALYDALGIRVKSLPMTAEKVLKAIKDKNSR